MDQQAETALLKERYTGALLAGDHREASRVVRDALDRGIDQTAIYLEMLGPALAEVGEAWVRGELSIAAEHLATSFTLQQIGYVREAGRRKDDIGARVVVAAVEGEMHSVGTQIIADLFHMEGWDVAHLGQNTPTEDLVGLIKESNVDLVILSLSRPDRVGIASRAAALLKGLENAPAVFVGGMGLPSPEECDGIQADLATSDLMEAMRAAREILGIDGQHPTLEFHLRTLGRRVQELRKERGWSQQRLASQADLDRTYLSAVEQGKQNITIGAALKIADALETSLPALIDLGRATSSPE